MHGDSDGYRFFLDAWGQAIVTGAITLIPTRYYPRWLRHALIWGFPATGAVAICYFAAKPQHLANLGERFGAGFQPTGEGAGARPALAEQGAVTGQDAVADAGAESGQDAVADAGAESGQSAVPEHVAGAGASESLPAGKNVLMTAAVGVPIAAAFSGVLAGAFWADEKIERGLRRARVPAPRVVMGIAAAAVTWYQVTSENKRSTPEHSAPA
ncbi:MAG TPA: hypothetical protein VK095_01730 [Beutenbergiaceae bacterium]|nr:hypothetical protein [Beutenbergiaceae bacterium]